VKDPSRLAPQKTGDKIQKYFLPQQSKPLTPITHRPKSAFCTPPLHKYPQDEQHRHKSKSIPKTTPSRRPRGKGRRPVFPVAIPAVATRSASESSSIQSPNIPRALLRVFLQALRQGAVFTAPAAGCKHPADGRRSLNSPRRLVIPGDRSSTTPHTCATGGRGFRGLAG
jgi:hypothetical protein